MRIMGEDDEDDGSAMNRRNGGAVFGLSNREAKKSLMRSFD